MLWFWGFFGFFGILVAVLLRPRRIPARYNRQPTVTTRRFVERRHRRRRAYVWQRWMRMLQRLQRKSAALGAFVRRFVFVFVAGLFALMIGLLFFSPILDVREIRVPRTDARIDVEQVQRSLAPLFRRHLFLLSAQEVQSLLKDAIPDLTSVSVQKRYPSSIVIRLALDPVIARLSIAEPGAGTGSGAAVQPGKVAGTAGDYLTSRGMYVVYQASQVKGSSQPRLRIVDWGARPLPWTHLIDPEFLLLMKEAEQALHEQFGQDVLEPTVFLRAQEFHVRTQATTLWFDRRSSLDEQLRRLRIFLRTVGLPAAKEYVDLRLTDRVVYR